MAISCLSPRWLYHKWKQWQITQNSPLLQLPPEILLLIEDHLNDAQRTAFRLTCHRLLGQRARLPWTLLGSDRAALLRLIEQDSPQFFYCHSCECLHTLRHVVKLPPSHRLCYSLEHNDCRFKSVKRGWCQSRRVCCSCDREEVFISSKYTLHFGLARLVVQRRSYEQPHRVPLELLFRTIHPETRGSFFQSTKEFWEAKTIDGHLFLSSSRFTNGDYDDVVPVNGTFTPGFDWTQYSICQHLDFGFRMKLNGLLVKSVEQYLKHTGSKFIGRCEHCLTNYELEQDFAAKSIRLTTYHCLGPCHSPDDWMWQCFNGRMKYETVMPTGLVSAPHPRKSWETGKLIYSAFEIKKKPPSMFAVAE